VVTFSTGIMGIFAPALTPGNSKGGAGQLIDRITLWGSGYPQLDEGLRSGGGAGFASFRVAESPPESVITSSGLAGFAQLGSVITPPSQLAGFAGMIWPRGARMATPAAFRWTEIVSRRTPMTFCICRSDHPSRTSATACCFFSSFKTLLTGTKDNFPHPLNVLSR
jgi:hypothetical protein